MTSYQDVFEEVFSNCDVLLSSIQKTKDPDTNPCESDLKEFHENIASISKVLSHEATKFAIAHSSPPFPDPSATRHLAGSLCNAASQLIGCYLLLPSSAGVTFLQVFSTELSSFIINLKQFVTTIQNIVINNGKLDSCLPSTGILWEFCDKLPTLPKNNAEAVNRVLSREEHLINDAIKELEQARQVLDATADISDSDDDDTIIRGTAVTLIPSVKGLTKSSAALIRKTRKLITSYSGSDQSKLDRLVENVAPLSTVVDDLICCLYEPANVAQAVEHGTDLFSHLQEFLDTVRGLAGEEDQKWIEMLATAVQHNLNNLQSKASQAL